MQGRCKIFYCHRRLDDFLISMTAKKCYPKDVLSLRGFTIPSTYLISQHSYFNIIKLPSLHFINLGYELHRSSSLLAE